MEIWTGKGDADGMIWFTKDNGKIVGRPYVRARVSAALSRFSFWKSLDERKAIIARTIDSDEWLRQRNGQTVSSIIRDVEMS